MKNKSLSFYSYAPNAGMHYHATKTEAKDAAEKSLRVLLNAGTTGPDLEQVSWGEVTERADRFGLKRQDLLSYESAHPQVVDGRMTDADGNLILLSNIHESDLLEHDLVLSIAVIWESLTGKMTRFKQYCFEDVTTYVDLLFEKFNAKRGGAEGNMTFTTFDRRYKLVIAIQRLIDFGPEVMVAKAKMLEAAKEMAPVDSNDLETLITATFTQIDGRLRVAEVLRLCNYKFSNATWNEAVKIVRDAIEVIGKKKQVRLYRRNEQGQYDAVSLNIAAL